MDIRKHQKGAAAVGGTVAIALAAALAWSLPSFAGVTDTPLPVLTAAGPSGGPVPIKNVFIVPGVVRHSNLRTEFVCTSLEPTASFRFGVEVFPKDGGPPINKASDPVLNGAMTLGPGDTRTIATGGTAGMHEDLTVEPLCVLGANAGAFCDCVGGICSAGACTSCPLTGGCVNGSACTTTVDCTIGGGNCSTVDIGNGSARIVSESKNITCSALIIDKVSNPPASMVSLKVIKKKQNGD